MTNVTFIISFYKDTKFRGFVRLSSIHSLWVGYGLYTSKGRRLNLAPRSSLLAALLFAVHPVHTECVSIVRPPPLHWCKEDRQSVYRLIP